VSNEAQVNDLVAFTLSKVGSLDALVLNAGIYGPMGQPNRFPRRMAACSRHQFIWNSASESCGDPHFKKAGRGKIVVLSGGGATNPCRISAHTLRRKQRPYA